MTGSKQVTLAYATSERQFLCQLTVPESATIQELLVMAASRCAAEDIPWATADVGIFGDLCDRDVRPRDGDRVELYRPLAIDPKESRRSRARRRGRDSG